jgi:uncharacterized protein YjiS (DUF1127 family)
MMVRPRESPDLNTRKDCIMFASLHTSSMALHRVQRRGGPGILAHLRAAMAVQAQRRRLADLDDARLDDLGLTRADVAAEVARPVWDVPATWRR